MSHVSRRSPKITFAALILALSLAISGAAASNSHAAAPTGATAAVDPGSYYVFRTRDTGAKATAEQDSRCNAHFGVRSLLTITRLNALLFSYESNAATGRIENQTAGLLGPGFICAVPSGRKKGDDVEAYAYSSLPGPGVVEATGPCGLAPVIVANLPLILNCALQVRPNPTKGVEGGLITSNSLVNTINRTESAPTGSVWTAHIVGPAQNAGGGAGPVPAGIKPETPGLDFFVTRTRDETTPTESDQCHRAGLAAKPLAIRRANLAVAQPDRISGLVPDAAGPSVATMTVCYAYLSNLGVRAFAIADLKTAAGTFSVRASGDCRVLATAAGKSVQAQSCSLVVRSGAAKGGLITSNGLTEVGNPASAVNSSIWTFALFNAPKAN